MFSDTESSYYLRYGMPRCAEGKAPRWEGESQVSTHLAMWPLHDAIRFVPKAAPDLQVDEDAFLRMREEFLQMKRKEQQNHQKMRECAPAIMPSLLRSTQYHIHCIVSHIPCCHVLSIYTNASQTCMPQHAAGQMSGEIVLHVSELPILDVCQRT